MKNIVHLIAEQQYWNVLNITAVHGGDINQAFCVTTGAGKFFVKLNKIKDRPQLFEKEAAGLKALQQHFPLKVPEVLAVGQTGETQYLVLEWLQQAAPLTNSEAAFGSALAKMHQATFSSFGWHEESCIASVPQINEWYQSWPAFYAEKRIMPLVIKLYENGNFTSKDVKIAKQFCNRLPVLIPEEPPALLHGDLWSGNVMTVSVNNETTTAIYDPNVFYGHREIDIAMTKLFGGFTIVFYGAYNEVYPLQNGWLQRLPLFQLYPLLVHAILFGGGYVGRAREIIGN